MKSERVAKWVEAACTQVALGGFLRDESTSHRRSSSYPPTNPRSTRTPPGQVRKLAKGCPFRRPAGDARHASCPHKLHAPSVYSHPPAAHKMPYARPLTIPEANEEDDGGGHLPVVSETTGRSSSRLSSSRLCDLEKLLSVESETSSGGVPTHVQSPRDQPAESCTVMHTPFSDDPPPRQQALELSPVPSCDYISSTSSAGLQEASQGTAFPTWLPPSCTAAAVALHRKVLPNSERASPVVGSPGGGCALERSLTCYPGQPAIDLAALMEAAVRSTKLQTSSSSAELASRCLPSVTLTTSAGATRYGLGDLAHSRMGSCPGPVPHGFAPLRCGARAAE